MFATHTVKLNDLFDKLAKTYYIVIMQILLCLQLLINKITYISKIFNLDYTSEGESKAFYEESEAEKKRNREEILQLRSGIKQIHIKIEESNQVSK